jgi:zinc-ribbon domain
VATCPDCGSENRDDARFCNECGAKLGLAIAEPAPTPSPVGGDEEGMASVVDEGGAVLELEPGEEAEVPESTAEASPEPEPESETDVTEPEGEAAADAAEAQADVAEEVQEGVEDEGQEAVEEEAAEEPGPPKTGYLVFPDHSEQPIPPSQWLIGRADLARFVSDPGKVNEISRGHLTVFQEGVQFFIEDGTTMVQRKASSNKTWLVRNGTRILVTGKGRNELQDADEIDVAELVTLQFVLR